MSQTDQMVIDQALMLLDREDPAQSKAIMRKLEAIYSNQSALAEEALNLLSQFEAMRHQALGKNRWDHQSLRDQGLALNGPDDARIKAYLHQLSKQPLSVLKRLGQVQDRFAEWLIDATRLAKQDPKRTSHCDALVQNLSKLNGLSTSLRKALSIYRLHGETMRVASIETNISKALEQWDLSRAWLEFNQLESVPDSLNERVRLIRDRILQTGKVSAQAMAFKTYSWPKTLDWDSAANLWEFMGECTQFMTGVSLPGTEKKRLQRSLESCQKALLSFLKNTASGALDMEALGTFQQQYLSLPGLASDGRFAQETAWFQKGLTAVLGEIDAGVISARDPESLSTLINQQAPAGRELPAVIRDQVEDRFIKAQALLELWRELLKGVDLTEENTAWLKAASPQPELLKSQMEGCLRWLEELKSQRKALHIHAENLEAQESARALIEEIFGQQPDHIAAQDLKKYLEELSNQHAMDKALGQLDLQRFFALLEKNNEQHPYWELHKVEPSLQLLVRAEKDPVDFSEIKQAQEWCELWHRVMDGISFRLPQPLAKKITHIRLDRKAELTAALEAFKCDQFSTEQWQQWLDLVVSLEEAFYLEDLVQRFDRWYRIHFITDLIGEEQWDEAEQELTYFAFDDHDYLRLSGMLKFKLAKKSGLQAMASAFLDSWSTLSKAFSLEELVVHLEETLDSAWDQRQTATLTSLQAALERILQESQLPPTKRNVLETWRECLALEPVLLERTTQQKHLVSFYELHKVARKLPFLKRWIPYVVESWLADDKALVLSLWAKKAFARLSFMQEVWKEDQDPEKRLKTQSLQQAKLVMRGLKSTELPEPEVMAEFETKLQRELDLWEELRKLLMCIPKKVSFPQMPAQLQTAFETVQVFKNVVAKLDVIAAQDLRMPEANLSLSLLYGELGNLRQDGFLCAAELRDQVSSLMKVSEAKFAFSQLMKLAEKCGDREYVDEHQLFAKLADTLQQFHRFFRDHDATHLPFWELLSGESLAQIPDKTGMLGPLSSKADFPALVSAIRNLEINELLFRDRVDKLRINEPTGKGIDPSQASQFLDLFPTQAPASKRAFILFYRYAQREDAAEKMHQVREDLPEWIQTYLDRGLPWS